MLPDASGLPEDEDDTGVVVELADGRSGDGGVVGGESAGDEEGVALLFEAAVVGAAQGDGDDAGVDGQDAEVDEGELDAPDGGDDHVGDEGQEDESEGPPVVELEL
ncbi:hypothetical protein J4558_23985 [Leptolyngbya sp. 15MV]|nr:hypothetical protein J4558_23985 [Leptolyngbya sp. 15MV]